MTYKIGLVIDDRRFEAIKDLSLASSLKSMFAGELRMLDIEVDDVTAKKILEAFPSARIDARGYLEDLPVSFKRALFDALVKNRGAVKEALEEILKNIERIKEQAQREKEYVPPP
ncbi:MAG: hypothetical protein TU36_000775 [Vulcanisaeta sp. AZ3]|jgi:hypothetical protein